MRSSGLLSFVPIVQSGVLAIYGIVISVLLSSKMQQEDSAAGYRNFSAGLSVGLACLASGLGMAGFIEDSIVAQQQQASTAHGADEGLHEPLVRDNSPRFVLEKPSPRFIMCLIFLEAIGLYGLIVALFLMQK